MTEVIWWEPVIVDRRTIKTAGPEDFMRVLEDAGLGERINRSEVRVLAALVAASEPGGQQSAFVRLRDLVHEHGEIRVWREKAT